MSAVSPEAREKGLEYNREYNREYMRRRRAEHPEEMREKSRKAWAEITEERREKRRDYARRWYAANPEKVREHARRQYNPERAREYNLKHSYNLTPEQFEDMKTEQSDVCAICGRGQEASRYGRFYVDHDHATGKVRGLLCNDCNRGLGCFRDNPDTLRAAIDHLCGRAA